MTEPSPRYRILRRLGQGGMAEVFEAELVGELGFVRKVAIKRLLGDAAAEPGIAERFLDEARIASRLHHANLVAVLDLGLLDGLPFHLLELVDGVNAAQLQQRAGGTLPLPVALAVVGEVARGLDHAHHACDGAGLPLGIVHRDVKPSNVMVSWTGDVKLSDFGIAVARDRAAQTEAGLVPGTSGYMAPEQRLRGQLDGRTDVFALGLTLHALLTGASPMADVAVEIAALEGTELPLDPDLPDDVRALIAGAVRVDRRARLDAAGFVDGAAAALARRGVGDVRVVVRAFVAEHGRAARPVGALDQLLGIEVVAGAPSATGVQQLVTRAALATPAPDGQRPAEAPTVAVRGPRVVDEATPGGAAPATTEDPALPPLRRRRRGALIGAGLVGLAAAAAAAVAFAALGGGAGPVASRASATSVDAAVTPGPVARAQIIDAPGPGPVDAAEMAVVTVDAAVVVTSRRDRRDARTGPATRPDAGAATSDPGEVVPGAVGYLQIVGEANVGARVLVDGRAVGFAPNKLSVPLGRHRVELVRADGTALPAQDLEVTTFHTFARPARPSW
ncbi:MAG: serine/threonine protein kinase [Kofleriaceae bacterium]|nr:serine/threonine protein kinase [Kofleriaceae bacterium]